MTNANTESPDARTPSTFLRDLIEEDVRTKKYGDAQVQTRFPPEPNGYLHIGHAKAICIDFGLADEFGGKTNLRFDDTNPEKEEQEYVDSIQKDVRWLGFEWDRLRYASDYFAQLYDWALQLIKAGKAYVDDLTAEEIRQYRGTLTEPGRDSPYRNRTVEENLDLFQKNEVRRIPRREPRAARQDRHGVTKSEYARSGDVSHSPCHAPTHRRQVVHLPDVRLRPRPVGLD